MEGTVVESVTFPRQQPAVEAARAKDGVAIFDLANKTYRALDKAEWTRSNRDANWHVVRISDTSPFYCDLDGCGELNATVLVELCENLLWILHEYDIDANLVVCDMSKGQCPSYHLTARGPRLPGMTSRQAASVMALAVSMTHGEDDPEHSLKLAGLVADFGPYNQPFPQMRAVGSRRSDGQGYKVPTHVASRINGVFKWETVEDTPTSRKFADCFYGEPTSAGCADSEAWLESVADRVYDGRAPSTLTVKIPQPQHVAARNFIRGNKRKGITENAVAPTLVDNRNRSNIAAYVENISHVIPVVAQQIGILAGAKMFGKKPPVFSPTKCTWTMVVKPSNEVHILEASIIGNADFGMCMIKASIPGAGHSHKSARKPMVVLDLAAFTMRYVCPWGSSHQNKKSMMLGLTGVQCKTIRLNVDEQQNMWCGTCTDISTTPTEVEVLPVIKGTPTLNNAAIRWTAEWTVLQVPVDLSMDKQAGQFKQHTGCPAMIYPNFDSQNRIADYEARFSELKHQLNSNMPRSVLKVAPCPRFGNATLVKVAGFEPSVLLWRFIKLLVNQSEPCLGVWVAEDDLLALVDGAIAVADNLDLMRITKLPGMQVIRYNEHEGPVAQKGVMIGLDHVFQMYCAIQPLVDALVAADRLIVATVNTPRAIDVYIKSLHTQWPSVGILVISPWKTPKASDGSILDSRRVSAQPDHRRTWVRYVNAMPVDSPQSVIDSVRETRSAMGAHVVVIWDAHLITSSVLSNVLALVGQASLQDPVHPAPAPPSVSILAANHGYFSTDGANLMQCILANTPSRVYICPDELDVPEPLLAKGKLKVASLVASSSMGMKSQKLSTEEVFKTLAVDPMVALSQLHDNGFITVMPIDGASLSSQHPDVYKRCMLEKTNANMCRYVLPGSEASLPPHLAHFRMGDKMDPVRICSFATKKCTLIVAVIRTKNASCHLQRFMWMVMQPRRVFEQVIVLADLSMMSPPVASAGPVKFGRIDKL